jgi:hypothetical protein
MVLTVIFILEKGMMIMHPESMLTEGMAQAIATEQDTS